VSTAEPPPAVPAPLSSENGTENDTAARTAGSPGLNQPWRGILAAGEVVLAVVAVVFGIVCWHKGVTTMVTPLGNGAPPLVSTIFLGNWMAGAIGLVTVAAFLVLDALRQVMLAVRTRRRPQPPEVTVAAPADLAV
jgi:hypothetical protein